MINSSHSRRLRRFILDSALRTRGIQDMPATIRFIQNNPPALDWVKVEAGDYRATLDNIEVRAVAYCVNLRDRPEWAIESRPIVSDTHRQTYGPTLWQPSSLDDGQMQMWPTMKAAKKWATSALISGDIEPNGSRGFLSPDGRWMGV